MAAPNPVPQSVRTRANHQNEKINLRSDEQGDRHNRFISTEADQPANHGHGRNAAAKESKTQFSSVK